MKRLRFRTKLFAALAAIVCASLALIALLLQDYTVRRVHAGARERFERTLAAFRQLEALRERFFADEVESLAASNPQFRPILATASLAATDLGFGGAPAQADPLRDANLRLNSLVPSLAIFAKSDIVLVANAAGELLYSRVEPHRHGDDLAGLALVREVAAEGSGEAIWRAGQRIESGAALAPERERRTALFHVLGRPILFDGSLHGIVLLGQEISEPVLRDLRAITGVEVVLLAEGAPAASTLAPELTSQAVARLARDGAGAADREWSLAGERFLARRAAVIEGERAGGAEFLLLSSLEPELAFVRRLTHMLAAVGGGVLAAALATSWALARGITRPVAALAHAARRVGAGDLDTRVAIATRDELEELGGAFNEMVSGLRERDRIRRSFERYVSKSVADEVLRNPELARLAGSRREITALFIDLGGFSALAETLAPEAVVAHLNEYFEAACRAILAEDGAVSEFQGDGVVAFWGAPIAHADDAARACRAALACEAELAALQQRWQQRGLSLAGFRIGLHTGEMVVGEVGAAERSKYAVVGDAMNLASRIEGANKHYGTRSLASEAARERAGDAVECREIDTVRVLGRRQPVRVFELLARAGRLAPERAAARERYAAGLSAYRARDWDAAERGFASALASDPADGPARVLLARVARFRAEPPPADWDGVFELAAK